MLVGFILIPRTSPAEKVTFIGLGRDPEKSATYDVFSEEIFTNTSATGAPLPKVAVPSVILQRAISVLPGVPSEQKHHKCDYRYSSPYPSDQCFDCNICLKELKRTKS